MKKPDLTIPLKFLKVICGDEGFFHATVIHPTKKKSRDLITDLNLKGMEQLWHYNKLGYGIYFTPNKTDGSGKRKTDNIESVRALFVDLDNIDLDNLGAISQMTPQPSIVVCTSQSKYHCYWLVDDCPLEQFTKTQQSLAKKYSGDPAVCDLPRLMRVAGFYHTKSTPFLTYTVEDKSWVH